MATENLREKIAMLENVIRNDDVQMLQHECIVESGATSTGDAGVDQAIAANATQSQAQIMILSKRLHVYRSKLSALQSELKDQSARA